MTKRVLALFVVVTLAATAAAAQGHSQGKGKGHGKGDSEAAEGPANQAGAVRRGAAFGEHDREIIGRYFHDNYNNLPPGLEKRGGNLPPGLQKQLERNGTLPPGLQKRVQNFPPELDRQLPPLPDNYRRVIVAQDAIILDRRTQRILDVIHDVVRP